MSAVPFDRDEDRGAVTAEAGPRSVAADTPVVVRRHAGVAAFVGAAASAVAIAYLWRAVSSSSALDWTLFAAMAVIGGYHLGACIDARTPLLVADDLGVRIRLGHDWRGLPWEAIGQVVVHPRRGVLRDGRLVFTPQSLARALEGLDVRGRRHVDLNQRMYGAALAVPVGSTTRVTGTDSQRLAEHLEALAGGRAAVVELDPATLDVVARAAPDAGAGESDGDGPDETVPADGEQRSHGPQDPGAVDRAARVSFRPAAALRETRPGLRAEAMIDLPTAGANALDADRQQMRSLLPEGRELRRPGSVDLVFEPVPDDARVRPISAAGDPVAPLVIDDYVTEPAYDPVIGPELAAARTRLGMSVDDLAERTRIRPHVIESVEVDDFAPCGGDFYARGHLRTMARILGKDPEPLLSTFEQRYASAPVNARRVFEAELATGMTGSIRSTVGGPNWGLLIGVVLSLALVWGLARLLAPEPVGIVEVPASEVNGSARVDGSVGVYGRDSASAAPGAGAEVATRNGLVVLTGVPRGV